MLFNEKYYYLKFANIVFRGLTREQLLKEEKKLKLIITVNAEFIVKANQDLKFRKILNENISTFDGQIPYLLAKLKNKNIYFEKLSGTDLIYDFCLFAKHNKKKVFLLGGYQRSNKMSVEKLKKYYNIKIAGYSPSFRTYPFDSEHNNKILDKIFKFKPDILFVGFGAIKQESWIYDNKGKLDKIGVKWAIGIGGTFEIVSGIYKRAPKWIQKVGLEGVYRMIQEPKLIRVKRLLLSLKIFKYIL